MLVLVYATSGLGISLGFHRLLTHRSLRLAKPLEYIAGLLGTLALQGGPISWVATHRVHHAHSDEDDDPHNAERAGSANLDNLRITQPGKTRATVLERFTGLGGVVAQLCLGIEPRLLPNGLVLEVHTKSEALSKKSNLSASIRVAAINRLGRPWKDAILRLRDEGPNRHSFILDHTERTTPKTRKRFPGHTREEITRVAGVDAASTATAL